MSFRYHKRRREKTLRKCAAMRAAKERLRLEHAKDEPVREALPLVALRVTIETSRWPREVYELRRKDDYAKRLHGFCNGERLTGSWSNSKLFRGLERRRYV